MGEPRPAGASPGRRRLRAALSVGLPAAALLVAAWFVHTHRAEFAALDLSRPHLIAPLAGLVPVMLLASGLQIRTLVHPFGVRLAPREWYGLAAITTFYNAVTPFRGGLLAKAAYLHRRHGLPLTSFTAVTAVLALVNLLAAGLLGLAGLLRIGLGAGRGGHLVAGILGALVLGTIAVLFLAPRLPSFRHPLLAPLSRISRGWHLIRSDSAAMASAVAVALAQYGLMTASTILSFALLGVGIDAARALFLGCVSAISAVAGLTPAGLGLVEAVAVFGGVAVGIPPAESLAAAVTRRVVSTAVVLAIGPLFSYGLLRGALEPGPDA